MVNATNRWLDRLAAADKANGGTGTDYKLAQLIGVDRQRISRYRRELEQMGNDPALMVAQQLGVHPMVVMAEIAAEKSRDQRMQRAWTEAAKHYAKKAALVGAVILAAGLSPSPAETALLVCILCKAARAANDDDFRAPQRLPTFKRGRVVTLSKVTATEPRRAA